MIIKIQMKEMVYRYYICIGMYCIVFVVIFFIFFFLQNVSLVDNCVIIDGRILVNNNFLCIMYQIENIIFVSLFNDGFKFQSGNFELSFSFNIMFMYQGFKLGIWIYLWRIIFDFVGQFGDFSVILGFVFDYK